MVYNIKWFSSYFKNFTFKFMQLSSWHHKLFHFHLPFWIGKFGKEEEKLKNFEYLENKKSFLDKIKNIFYRFWGAIIWWKNKNLLKNSRFKPLKSNQKTTVEATGDLIGNNIAHKITKRSPQNTSETVKSETGILKQRYIPPEKDSKLLMN